MRILLTGGGTGGHIYPLIAVVEKIKDISINQGISPEFYYVGVSDVYETMLESQGIKVQKLISAKLRRYFDIRNIVDIPKLGISVIQSIWKVFWLMPDVVFSKGGPGALPVVIAASIFNIPIIIHESDIAPGITNLLSAKMARRIAISFEEAAEIFIANGKNDAQKQKISAKIALVGNPIRDLFFKNDNLSTETAKKIIGFNSEKPTLLIVGGSQGAVRINDFFISIARELLFNNFQIIHQTGKNNFENAKNELNNILAGYSEESKQQYKMFAYFDNDIKDIYQAADLIISRAGSGSIFEIAVMGKPSILIPLPEAAYDHQVKNAFFYAKTGASVVIEEVNLTNNLFFTQLKKIFEQSGLIKNMSDAAKKFAKPEAAMLIAQEVLKLGQKK